MLLSDWRPKQFISGEGFAYLGRHYRLRIINRNGDTPNLRLSGGWFELRRGRAADGQAEFAAWYTLRGKAWLPHRIDRFASRFHVKDRPIDVRDLGYRWGSCGVRGLNFHWRTMTLPPRVIDYVIVHELAHVPEPNHGRAFWDRVQRTLPDFEERRRWLAQHGGDA